ncbi:MAG: carboxymuconolactone decarboxylase family protein [Sporomusaceae bacterium]|nr:carboxymuconolactone decarboxylase family protein [Sporomusaceae bacterium]
MNPRYEQGLKKFKSIFGEDQANASLKEIEAIAPDFGRHIVEFAFGDIFQRGVLSLKQREMILITALTTLGTEDWLGAHIRAGLDAGITPSEIVETIVHTSLPAGLPRVLNALKVAKLVFAERGIQ